MLKYLLVVMSIMFLMGCEAKQVTQETTTEEVYTTKNDADILYFYVIDDIHRVVGFGSWGDDGLFHITTLTSQVWDVPASSVVIRSEVTKEALASQTK